MGMELEETVEDAEVREQRLKREEEQRKEAERQKMSTVLKMGLPRPKHVNWEILKYMPEGPEKMVAQEMLVLI